MIALIDPEYLKNHPGIIVQKIMKSQASNKSIDSIEKLIEAGVDVNYMLIFHFLIHYFTFLLFDFLISIISFFFLIWF
jgi:hypothetical protein